LGGDQKMKLQEYVNQPGGLLKALHALQNQNPNHFLSPQDLEKVSKESTVPRGRHIIRVCESAPCHVVGAVDILKALEQLLRVKTGETTTDGKFTLEVTSCLGICGVAPAIMIGDTVHGNLTPERLASVLALYH